MVGSGSEDWRLWSVEVIRRVVCLAKTRSGGLQRPVAENSVRNEPPGVPIDVTPCMSFVAWLNPRFRWFFGSPSLSY